MTAHSVNCELHNVLFCVDRAIDNENSVTNDKVRVFIVKDSPIIDCTIEIREPSLTIWVIAS